MSIFGQLDAATIPSNPFFIAEGEYTATVTKAYIKKDREEREQLIIVYTITSEESQYLDKPATDYFKIPDRDLTQEKLALLPAEEQKAILNNLSSMKRRLSGNPKNKAQPGLGVPLDDLNDADWDPEILVGREVNLAISNYGADKEGVNVKWVNLIES